MLTPVANTFSAKEIAARTDSTEASVRTIIGNCNSTASSNERYNKLGICFAKMRGKDTVRRLQ